MAIHQTGGRIYIMKAFSVSPNFFWGPVSPKQPSRWGCGAEFSMKRVACFAPSSPLLSSPLLSSPLLSSPLLSSPLLSSPLLSSPLLSSPLLSSPLLSSPLLSSPLLTSHHITSHHITSLLLLSSFPDHGKSADMSGAIFGLSGDRVVKAVLRGQESAGQLVYEPLVWGSRETSESLQGFHHVGETGRSQVTTSGGLLPELPTPQLQRGKAKPSLPCWLDFLETGRSPLELDQPAI